MIIMWNAFKIINYYKCRPCQISNLCICLLRFVKTFFFRKKECNKWKHTILDIYIFFINNLSIRSIFDTALTLELFFSRSFVCRCCRRLKHCYCYYCFFFDVALSLWDTVSGVCARTSTPWFCLCYMQFGIWSSAIVGTFYFRLLFCVSACVFV